jgi:tetratricopeptide (TPR) repeat protein
VARERIAPRTPEAISLLGDSLYPLTLTPEERTNLETNLAVAEANLRAHPDDPEATIWLGRRLAYLGRYRDAIAVYSRGIERWPNSFKLYRHRGHRFITVRDFDAALADLERAAALIEAVPDSIEPDGAPNAAGIPRSTSHSNIWYHLGLAHYLKGDFERARHAYRECMRFSTNDDMRVATSDWLYMTCRRLGANGEAKAVLEPIQPKMEILENRSYHRRLLMYKGLLPPDSLLVVEGASDLDLATQGYGVGNWHLCNGDTASALQIFTRVLEGKYWPAFGYIAAEVDRVRLQAD